MDARMAAQEHVALARSLVELYNSHQSDPAWLEKTVAAFAADFEVIDVPSGATLHGPEGYKQFMRFFVEAWPGSRAELTNVVATEDQVVLEGSIRGTTTGSRHLPTGAMLATGRSGELRLCQVMQIRKGKIVRVHTYYDMMTLREQLGLKSATA
jgi:predicted ester cyclase